jgi:hypothetical protein
MRGGKNVFETYFGIEIKFSGITRSRAAEIVAKVVNGTVRAGNEICMEDGRVWKVVYDCSVGACVRQNGRTVTVNDSSYQCELVSPILTYYRDIGTVQAIVREASQGRGNRSGHSGYSGTVNLPGKGYFNTILEGYNDFGIDPVPLFRALREAKGNGRF